MKSSGLSAHRIAGLDSMRIVLALIVAFSHGFGIDFQSFLSREQALDSFAGSALWLLAGNLYNGQAAVIVFFLISGFVIHYPYARGHQFDPLKFLIARFLRISLPLSVVLLIAGQVFDVQPLSYMGVWSLVCELVYYFLYPYLRRLRNFLSSWLPLYWLTLLIAAVVLWIIGLPQASQPGRLQDFPAFGPQLTWLVGLPIWILGCHAAETDWSRIKGPRAITHLWLARLVILGLSIAFSILKFHGDKIIGSDVPNYLSLHIFALFAYQWMRWEIYWHYTHSPNRVLEWGGRWSYSLYIVHPLIYYALPQSELGFTYPIGVVHGVLSMIFVCLIAYLFYRLFELPSHRFAKSVSIKVNDLFVTRLGSERAR